jgi:hypothetical protein
MRRIGDGLFLREGVARNIGAKHIVDRRSVGRRLDTVDIHLVELLDIGKHVVELRLKLGNFVVEDLSRADLFFREKLGLRDKSRSVVEFEFETYAELETFADENREDCTMCRTEEVTA